MDDDRPALLVGRRVRSLREQAGLSMRALAGKVGVSQPFLSQLENGSSSPSMITIYRLAEALGVTPGALLPTGATDPATGPATDSPVAIGVVRAGEGEQIPVAERADAAVSRALLMSPAATLEVLEYRIAPGEFIGDWFTSIGETAVYLLEGRLQVELEGAGTWTLAAGDFIHHPGETPHRWLPVPGVTARVLLIAHRDPAPPSTSAQDLQIEDRHIEDRDGFQQWTPGQVLP